VRLSKEKEIENRVVILEKGLSSSIIQSSNPTQKTINHAQSQEKTEFILFINF
jgi:hypothetical protein